MSVQQKEPDDDSMVLLKYGMLKQMKKAFQEVSDGMGEAVKDLAKLSGRVAEGEAKLKRLVNIVDRIASHAT